MFGGNFGEVGGRALVALLVVELDPDAVDPDLPIEEVHPLLEVTEDRHGDVELGELVSAHGREATVFERTSSKKSSLHFGRGGRFCDAHESTGNGPCSLLTYIYISLKYSFTFR